MCTLLAAVARHKTRQPSLASADSDAAWRAAALLPCCPAALLPCCPAALLPTMVRRGPLPYHKGLFAVIVVAQYMAQPDYTLSALSDRLRPWLI
ncbi:hypothetical protein [Streptomyces sp. PA5.6]|uniref:hypothetical protein n=1 Tax=Streptomyces sp. PA5.6 TaxID=3035651 RepID=UPI0039047250